MDIQHKRLVELVNRIYDAMREGKGDQAAQQTLEDIVLYVRTHFTAEEALMQQVGYPHLSAHQAKHRALTAKAKELMEGLKAGKMVATVRLATFLKDWLVNHIQHEDRQYGIYIVRQQQAVLS